MSGDLEHLTGALAELQTERNRIDALRTKEDLVKLAEDWLSAARTRSSGTMGYVLNGHARQDLIAAVLAEYALQDERLLPWLVSRLEQFDTAGISERQKKKRLAELDAKTKVATSELVAARKAAALADVEAEFAGEAA
jgi:hypothetical protein